MTTSERIRRDPQNGKNGLSTANGFTLIELMVVIAVLAIITSLALPSYRTLIEKRQVTSGAQQIGAFLSAAQLEAVRRNEFIAVHYEHSGPDDWCLGFVNVEVPAVNFGDANDCTCSADPAENTCKIDGADRVMVPANLNYAEALDGMDGDGVFVIDPVRGAMVDFTETPAFQFLSQPEETYALNVEMVPTGRVRICSASADKAVPGFDEC
jgi:type IV fimbrial biogenesis protein FimT